MSTLRCTNLQDTAGSNSLTTAQIYNGTAKAWVNFNGTGTVAIRAQFNVSSITDNAAGRYTINFATAMVDANYSATGMASNEGSFGGVFNITSVAVGSLGVWYIQNNSPAFVDPSVVAIAIFR